ncbi:hypothetical protein HKK80_11275 [Halonotius sp. F2-221B]|uniref:hypothetical protein n=1 Tax=Halonotius sp. F2-221B TaxID=2731620 RepID=UPI00398AE0CC
MFDDITRRTLLGSVGSTVAFTTLSASGVSATNTESSTPSTPGDGNSLDTVGFTSTGPPSIAVSYEQFAANQHRTSDQVSVSESTDTVLTVGDPNSGSLARGETINLWAGRVDTSGAGATGVPNAELALTVERPDGQTDEFTNVTNDDGNVVVPYSSTAIPGEYQVTVTGPDNATTSDMFTVGPVLEPMTQSGRARPVLRNDTATFRFLLREAQSPISGKEVTLTLSQDGSEIDQTTVQSDSDGFVTYTDTPQETGDRTIEAATTFTDDSGSLSLTASTSYPVSKIGYEYDFFDLDETTAGSQTGQGGRIWTADGPLSNTEIQLSYTNEEDTIEITETTTTDEHGFFAVQFAAPTDTDELAVSVATADGRSAALGTFAESVDVEEPPAESSPDPVNVDVSFDNFRTPPGTTASVEISVTDADGTPITDESVTTIARYDYGGDAVPVTADTVVTDSEGQATLEITVPNDAPANERLNVTATVSQNGDQFSGDDGTTIEKFDMYTDPSLDTGAIELELDVTDAATDTPVSGINSFNDIQYVSGRTGSITGQRLTSSSDGTDLQTAQVPDDISYMVAMNTVSKQQDNGGFSVYRGYDYPGEISANVDGESINAGSTVSFTYEAEAASVKGLLYGQIGSVPVATTFDTSVENPSITLPENIYADSLDVRVWGVGSDGGLYSGSTSIDLDSGGGSDSPDENPDEGTDTNIPSELDSQAVTAIVEEAGVNSYQDLDGLAILDSYTAYLSNNGTVGGTQLESSLPILDVYTYYLENPSEFN